MTNQGFLGVLFSHCGRVDGEGDDDDWRLVSSRKNVLYPILLHCCLRDEWFLGRKGSAAGESEGVLRH